MRTRLSQLLLLLSLGFALSAQGLSPNTPAKEYINWNGQTIATEDRTLKQPSINVDFPIASAAYSGLQAMSGWAIDLSAAIASVDIAIDGISYGAANYGASRPDVCQLLGNYSGCPNVGWSIPLNTAEFANGLHTFTVTATTNDSIPRTATVRTSFLTNNAAVSAANTSRMYVDVPAWNSTYDGSQTFSGWAFDSTALIARVSVAIDGVSYGNARYGGNRGDVCQFFGNYPGCPNVGWAFPIDTSNLSEGQHELVVTTYTSEPTPRHTTSTIAFTVANEYGPSMYVDSPAANVSWQGMQTVSGWALDSGSTIGAVAISIDGNAYGLATYGGNRSDVCQFLGPNDPGCPNVGWSFNLNTSTLTNGYHVLTATAFTAEEDPSTISQSVRFSTNNVNPASQNQSMVDIDVPVWNKFVEGTQHFFGWSIDNTSAIASISYAIDGIPYGNANYGYNRQDACNAYPGRAGCPNVGWDFFFDTARLTDGFHTLAITAFTNDGVPRQTTSTVSFGTSNSH